MPPTFEAGIAQLVEHNLAKVGVASSSLVSRSNFSSEITEHPNKEKQSDSRSQGASDDVHVAQRLPVEMFTQVSFRLLGLGSNNSKTKQRA